MSEDFRKEALAEIERLLKYWRTIEFWIKRVEQVNNQAVIPAINELRYASRQLFNAQRIFDKSTLTDGEKSVIRKRLNVAEQYLMNSDHDVADALVGFYRSVTHDANSDVGESEITQHFTKYPLLLECIDECDNLIAESRGDYTKRLENYNKLRDEHYPVLMGSYKAYKEAEIAARKAKVDLENKLILAEAKIKAFGRWNIGLAIVSILGTCASVVAVPLAFYLWIFAHDDFCELHGKKKVLQSLCTVEKPKRTK